MFAPIIPLLATLSPAPLDRVEVHHGPDFTQVVALDAQDEVAAEIVVQILDDGYIRIYAAFLDDIQAAVTLAGNGEVIDIDNEDHELVMPRIAEVLDLLAETEQAGWGGCAFHSVMTIVEIAHANPILVATGILAACECLPLLVDEYKDIECPWL